MVKSRSVTLHCRSKDDPLPLALGLMHVHWGCLQVILLRCSGDDSACPTREPH